MGDMVPARRLAHSFSNCAELLGAVGHKIDRDALVKCLTQEEGQALEVRKALEGRRKAAQIAPEVVERMDRLQQRLVEGLSSAASAVLGVHPIPSSPGELAVLLKALPQREKDALADTVLLNGHGQFLEPRYISAAEFRKAVKEQEKDARLALVKLVPHLQQELRKRGFEMPEDRIRKLFDPKCDDPEVPRCLKWILRNLNGEFNGGLVDIQEMVGDKDPDQWLDATRKTLQFRSHTAMHKAIAEATSLKYDCVHKALSGRHKAKRVQAEIKYCLDRWLEDVAAGRAPDIEEDYRGVPVEQVRALLPVLEQKFSCKEGMYRLIAARTGVKPGSVRRYFHSNGQLKYAPLSVYRSAEALAEEGPGRYRPRSYLADNRTRRVARRLAQRAQEVLEQWRRAGESDELEIAYKELRLALIVAIKQQAHGSAAAL